MDFLKDFEALLAAILTDYRNQYPDTDLSEGSLIYIKSACLASALWGLYKYQDWIARQIFPDTADTAQLEHHAWLYEITRKTAETDSDLLTRVLEYMRNPPAGGNKLDYERWAETINGVDQAFCIPLGQGLCSVDVIVIASQDYTGSEIPSSHAISGTATSLTESKLIDSAANYTGSLPVRKGDIVINNDLGTQATVTAVDSANQLSLDADILSGIGQSYTIKSLIRQVRDYIETVRPVGASLLRVLPPVVLTQAVTISVAGTGINKSALSAQISAYIGSLNPGDTLYISRLISIVIEAGATNAVICIPTADVTVNSYTMMRPGAVNIL